MLQVLCFCLVLSFYPLQVNSKDDGYTWEDYDGTIPPNAMPASDDPNNPVYIGTVLLKYRNYSCSGAIIPGEMEMITECGTAHSVKDKIKILIVEDKAKFKWVPTSRDTLSKDFDKEDLVITNYQESSDSYSYVGRFLWDNGTLEVTDTTFHNSFYSMRLEQYIPAYDVLVHIRDKIGNTNVGLHCQSDLKKPVASKEPSTPKIPTVSNSAQPSVDDVDCNVNADVDVQDTPKEPVAPKEPPTPKIPAASNSGQPTVDMDINVGADVDVPDTPKEPAASTV